MEIAWYGHSCFRLLERGKATIITDPFGESLGYPLPKLKGDVVTISHDAPGHNNYMAVKGVQRVIDRPGEYEIGGVFIIGVALHNTEPPTPKQNVAYVIDYDGVAIVHLGDLDHIPSQSVIELLAAANVLLVPVGGGGGLHATQAVEIISLLEPNIVIPMHYKTPESRVDLEPNDRFLKEMGVSRVQQEQTFKITAGSLPEQMQIVVLECSR
jgi:L-ascorbate metabolism protein UlaG (beta-lactamase superfamily)